MNKTYFSHILEDTAVSLLTHMLPHLCCAIARQHVACGNSWVWSALEQPEVYPLASRLSAHPAALWTVSSLEYQISLLFHYSFSKM